MDRSKIMLIVEEIEARLGRLRSELQVDDAGRGGSPSQRPQPFPVGPFEKVGEEEAHWSYRWPPDEVVRYDKFQRYRAPNGLLLGIGHAPPHEYYGRERLWAVVHTVGREKQLNALVVFTGADDFETSRDLLALIKGKGDGGRQMFRPGDSAPAAYQGARIETFSDRVTGPNTRNGLAVVCREDDAEGLLSHALIQMRIRQG